MPLREAARRTPAEPVHRTRIRPEELHIQIEVVMRKRVEDVRCKKIVHRQAEHSSHSQLEDTGYTQPAEHSTSPSTEPNQVPRPKYRPVVQRVVHVCCNREKVPAEATFAGLHHEAGEQAEVDVMVVVDTPNWVHKFAHSDWVCRFVCLDLGSVSIPVQVAYTPSWVVVGCTQAVVGSRILLVEVGSIPPVVVTQGNFPLPADQCSAVGSVLKDQATMEAVDSSLRVVRKERKTEAWLFVKNE